MIHALAIPTPFMVGRVNCYLIEDDPLTLVDTGPNSGQSLDALESAGIVLDPSNNVMKASPGAISSGLVFHQALVHPELVSMVDRVRRSGEPLAEGVVALGREVLAEERARG